MTLRYLAAPLLAAALSACAGEPPTNAASADDVPRFLLVEELRIGDTNDPDLGFSRIGGVAVDDDGLAYVLDANGEPRREVLVPNTLTMYWMGGDVVWAVERDGFDVSRRANRSPT